MPFPTHLLKTTLARTVSYIDRLPLFTRLVIVLAVGAEFVGVLPWVDVRGWGRLEPDLIGLSTSTFLYFYIYFLGSLLCGGAGGFVAVVVVMVVVVTVWECGGDGGL